VQFCPPGDSTNTKRFFLSRNFARPFHFRFGLFDFRCFECFYAVKRNRIPFVTQFKNGVTEDLLPLSRLSLPQERTRSGFTLKSLFFSSLAHKIREDWPSLLPSFFLLLLGVTKELDEERPPVSNLYPTPYEGALARLTPKGQSSLWN